MNLVRSRVLLASTILGVFAGSALAGSLATSSAAGGSSASLAASSASETVEGSSASSKRAVAGLDGPYRVVEVTPVPERPGTVRMTLRPLAGGASTEDVRLLVPQQAPERGGLAQGATVTANRRPYGVELAHADTRKAFFLVLDDGWRRELQSNPVAL